eukprot:CAMPEP_0172182160 /NCGR_PEP_ID=MMETSP1050-20130122/18236_1 /TAXON_ID=233186 /ORGANISM="Cryptomonas curvata, Strain CCAP979/52" /LENGTH=55 /DNA_ID=CAMNT_0012855557 /DNA_START=649 /DNA_END=813 /DNA_ORIENTATION=+
MGKDVRSEPPQRTRQPLGDRPAPPPSAPPSAPDPAAPPAGVREYLHQQTMREQRD